MMAGMFDVHAQIREEFYKQFDINNEEILSEAKRYGVDNVINTSFDIKSSREAFMSANRTLGLYSAVGLNPQQSINFTDEDIELLDEYSNAEDNVAIGEIGLDFTDNTLDLNKQILLFEKQLDLAKKNKLAVMLVIKDNENSKEAHEKALKLLIKHKIKKAVVLNFSSTYEVASDFAKNGYYISVSPLITFANSNKAAEELTKIVNKISLNRLVVETNSPFSLPFQKHKKPNYPKNLVYVVKEIATIKGMEVDDVISSTRTNTQNLFGLI